MLSETCVRICNLCACYALLLLALRVSYPEEQQKCSGTKFCVSTLSPTELPIIYPV